MVKLKIFSLLFLIFTFIISCSPDMIQTTELSEDEKQKNISDQQKQKIENDAVEILFSSATESTETLKEGPKTTGTLKEGGIQGEGQFHLVRPGGVSQNVYLTSSSVDLSKFVGKKIKVWGETEKAQYAGWLMDAGRVEVIE